MSTKAFPRPTSHPVLYSFCQKPFVNSFSLYDPVLSGDLSRAVSLLLAAVLLLVAGGRVREGGGGVLQQSNILIINYHGASSLSEQNGEEMENEINTDDKNKSMTITPDFILESNQVHI